MIRRPFGSIDPNSIRETELHTECRRKRERESLNSPQHDRERDAARQRAAATRMRETDEARAERCVRYVIACGVSSRTHLVRRQHEYTWCGGETSTSKRVRVLVTRCKKKKTKSSTEKQITAIIVHEAKRTATSTRTTHTRHNKPFEAAAVVFFLRCQQRYALGAAAKRVRVNEYEY